MTKQSEHVHFGDFHTYESNTEDTRTISMGMNREQFNKLCTYWAVQYRDNKQAVTQNASLKQHDA